MASRDWRSILIERDSQGPKKTPCAGTDSQPANENVPLPGFVSTHAESEYTGVWLFADDFYEDSFGQFAFEQVNHAALHISFEDLAGGLGCGLGAGVLR